MDLDLTKHSIELIDIYNMELVNDDNYTMNVTASYSIVSQYIEDSIKVEE